MRLLTAEACGCVITVWAPAGDGLGRYGIVAPLGGDWTTTRATEQINKHKQFLYSVPSGETF